MGLMCTIKPLVQCFQTFTQLKILIINNLSFTKLHFMAIDNFLISNPNLKKLVLINVNMTNESLKLFSGTISCSTTLKSLNLSQNNLKDSGAIQLSEILLSNQTL